MRELLVCILCFLAAFSHGLSSLCPPRRLALTQPCPVLQMAKSFHLETPISAPVEAPASSNSIVESLPPSDSPQPSISGHGWSKAKTGGVVAGGSIAVVGAVVLVSKLAGVGVLGVVGEAGLAGKRALQTAFQWTNFKSLGEVAANTRDVSRYPVYNGEDAGKFIQEYEKFARQHKMKGNLLNHVEVYLDPEMREWYRAKLSSGEIVDWKGFSEEFHKEFGREELYENVIEELEGFEQGANEAIDDYARRALDYVSRLDRVNPCQHQKGQISNNEKYVQIRFLAGLKSNVREKVKAGVKGLKNVSWDILQAVAKAVSFDTVEKEVLDLGKASGSVLHATELLGTQSLSTAGSIVKECLEVQTSDFAQKLQGTVEILPKDMKLREAAAEIEKLSSTIAMLRSQVMLVQQHHHAIQSSS